MKKFGLHIFAAILTLSLTLSAKTQSSGNQQFEDRINRQVHHELVMLPQLTIFDNLAYKVDGTSVTLLGQVRTAVLKDAAAGAVKRIEGVTQVDNEIVILPPSPNDDRIRRQVARTLFHDARLFPYSLGTVPPIHIIVSGGHVTLEGVVNNQGDKNVAGIRANEVAGVFSVKNDLQVAD